ncbi:MAG: aldehyde dehydrogenase family protein [Candidatus Binatia bacterium]
MRKLHLELGGNNACIVLQDADLDLAAREIVRGRLMMNGQACSASKRIIVHPELHDPLVARLRTAVEDATADRSRDDRRPADQQAAAQRVGSQVRRAVAEGATLLVGSGSARGPYLDPCVLGRTPAHAGVATDDEIFGPVFTPIEAATPSQAVALANASSYGLMASVFTADLGLAPPTGRAPARRRRGDQRNRQLPLRRSSRSGTGLSGGGREGLGYKRIQS